MSLPATKAFVFLSREPGSSRSTFQEAGLAGLRSRADDGFERLVVDVLVEPPADRPYRPDHDTEADGARDPDLVVEVEPLDVDGADWDAVGRGIAAAAGAGRWFAHLVHETTELDVRVKGSGERVPGIAYLGLIRFHDDLSPAAGRRLWAHHARLGLDVHVGMTRYVRSWVVGSVGEGAPTDTGVAELHFPSRDALADEFFADDRARRAIEHDTAHFIASGTRFYAEQHVLVRPHLEPNA